MDEKRRIKSKQHQDLLDYKHINSIYKKYLHHSKKTHISSKLNDNKNKTKNLYKILKLLTKLKDENPMPPTESPSDLPYKFADFFLNKIEKIKEQFHDPNIQKSYYRKCTKFTNYVPLEKDEILSIIIKMNPTTFIMASCNTRFLLKFKETILDAITTIVNQSLTTGTFLDDWKVASVRPLIKGPDLDTKLKTTDPLATYLFFPK